MNLKKLFIYEEAKEPWQIAAARWCVEHSKSFIRGELEEYITSKYIGVHKRHVEFFFQQEIQQPSGRNHNRDAVEGTFTPPLDLVSKVIDHDELREARKNAWSAQRLAIISIIISSTTLLATIFPYVFTQC